MSYRFPPTRLRAVRLALAGGFFAGAGFLGGCNDAQAGALLGAGIGALAGQAIGHDTQATLIGAAVGTGAGYIIGNESDKATRGPSREYEPGPRYYDDRPQPRPRYYHRHGHYGHDHYYDPHHHHGHHDY